MLALAGALAWSIWVTAPDPPGACPLAADVATSLTALVPEATVEVGGAPGADALRLSIAAAVGAAGAELRVVLADAGGARLLERSLPAAGACPELAESVALVIERYLSDLGWQAAPVAIEPAPRTPTRPAPVPADDAVTVVRRPPPRAAAPVTLALTARAQLALGATQPGAAAGAMLGWRALRAGVEVGAAWPRSEDVARDGGGMIGELSLSSLHVLAGVGAQRGRFLAGAWVGGERVAASAAGGAVFQRVDQAGWQAVVRADLGYDLPLTRRLALRTAAGLEVRPAPLEVRIEGSSQIHASPTARAVVGAGLTWRLR